MYIKENGLYNYLVKQKTERLNEKIFIREYKKGEVIYGPSKHYTHIYEIMDGAIKLGSISSQGIEVMHEIVLKDDFFGNLRLLEKNTNLTGNLKGLHKPFSEFSKALVDSEICCYDYDFFKYLIINDPNVAEWFYPKIVSRWCKTESLFIGILSLPPRERIEHVHGLYNANIKMGLNKEINLNSIMSFQELADLTGTTRQLVANTLKIKHNIAIKSNTLQNN